MVGTNRKDFSLQKKRAFTPVLQKMETSIAVFRGKGIRKTIHNNEWWFVIVDVVSVLTDSVNPSGYIKDMRRRDKEFSKGWGQIATPLSVQTEGGHQRMNCANIEGIFRNVQSIPSPKAEPFKRWLAKVGYKPVPCIRRKAILTIGLKSEAGHRHQGGTYRRVEKQEARTFYAAEAVNAHGSTWDLERQINSLLFEQLALSRGK